jgi:hypothetical protein
VKVGLKSELFTYTVDEAAKAQAELMDGKLLLATNVADLTPTEVVQRYKALATQCGRSSSVQFRLQK